jgi:hypothetical protein
MLLQDCCFFAFFVFCGVCGKTEGRCNDGGENAFNLKVTMKF